MKIIAFGASYSSTSINKTLAAYASSFADGAEVEVLDLNDFDLPLFTEDREKEIGQPKAAKDFLEKIAGADAVIVSFAEHNGSYTAAYKNLHDWASRIEVKIYQNKPAVFLSTSPGKAGASNVLNAAVNSAAFYGADLKASLSVASFYDAFDLEENHVRDPQIVEQIKTTVRSLVA